MERMTNEIVVEEMNSKDVEELLPGMFISRIQGDDMPEVVSEVLDGEICADLTDGETFPLNDVEYSKVYKPGDRITIIIED